MSTSILLHVLVVLPPIASWLFAVSLVMVLWIALLSTCLDLGNEHFEFHYYSPFLAWCISSCFSVFTVALPTSTPQSHNSPEDGHWTVSLVLFASGKVGLSRKKESATWRSACVSSHLAFQSLLLIHHDTWIASSLFFVMPLQSWSVPQCYLLQFLPAAAPAYSSGWDMQYQQHLSAGCVVLGTVPGMYTSCQQKHSSHFQAGREPGSRFSNILRRT